MNSHSKQHPSGCSSDYTNQIHYTETDHHVRRCSFKGEHQYVHHIIHMTHALPFGFPCSEAMSVHARLVKLTSVFRMCKSGLHPLYANVESITPDHHEVSQNDELWQRCILRENTLFGIKLRDHLIIMLPSSI